MGKQSYGIISTPTRYLITLTQVCQCEPLHVISRIEAYDSVISSVIEHIPFISKPDSMSIKFMMSVDFVQGSMQVIFLQVLMSVIYR